MHFDPHRFYHVYNQGNDRQKLFDTGTDEYLVFLKLTRRIILPHADLIAYCLMPNHFHMMVKTDERCMKTMISGRLEIGVLSFGFGRLLSSYTRIVNKRRGCTGSLFRQGTHARCLDHDIATSFAEKEAQSDLMNVFRYIHENPVKANLVTDASEWPYSSYPEYKGIRSGSLVNKRIAWEFGLGL